MSLRVLDLQKQADICVHEFSVLEYLTFFVSRTFYSPDCFSS